MRKNRNRMWMQLPVVAGCTLMLATACQPSTGTQLPTGNYEIMTVSTSRQELTTAYSATTKTFVLI